MSGLERAVGSRAPVGSPTEMLKVPDARPLIATFGMHFDSCSWNGKRIVKGLPLKLVSGESLAIMIAEGSANNSRKGLVWR